MFVINNLIFYTFTIYLYKVLWNKYIKERVPKGIGIIFCISVSILAMNLQHNYEFNNFFLFLLVIILSLIYWIDDLLHIPSIIRLCIQFIMGVFLFIIIFDISFFVEPFFYYLSAFFLGILSIFLTNTINFYDGADLNISIFGLINLLLLLFIFNSYTEFLPIIISSIIFILCFSFFNYKPKNIFFGDAGSFFLSTLIIFFICIGVIEGNYEMLYILIGLSLPIFDVIYVIILRIYLRESLNTRHFYQIYQLVQSKFKNKSYILIQPINSVLILFCLLIFSSYGLNVFLSTFFSSILVTILFYCFVRFVILK